MKTPGSRLVPCLLFALLATGCPSSPEDRTASTDAIARQNNLGVAWLGQQNWVDAEADLRRGLEVDPEEPVLLVNLAIALVQQGRAAEAREALERARNLDPGNLHARYGLGLLAKGDGRLEEAATHFEHVRKSDPDDVSNLYNVGATLAALDRGAEAEEAFRAALARNPVHTSASYGLGRLLVSSGDADEGRRLIALSQELRARSGVDDTVGNRYGEQGYYALGIDWPTERVVPPEAVPLAWDRGPVTRAGPWTAGSFGSAHGRVIALGPDALNALDASGRTAFARAPDLGAAGAIAAGDVTGDGTLDLVAVIANRDELELAILERAGAADASWRRAATTPLHEGARVEEIALTLLDRDHDGDLDGLACFRAGGRTTCRFATQGEPGVFTIDGDRGLAPAPSDAGPVTATFGDYDLDRDVDVVVADASGVRLYANRRDGTFEDVSEATGLRGLLQGTGALDLADVDRDGRFDLLAATNEGVFVCTSSRRGRFTCARVHDAPASGVVALDADDDGFLDVTFGSPGEPLVVLRNRGIDGFEPTPAGKDVTGAPRLAFDADGDRDLDLLVETNDQLALVVNEHRATHASVDVQPVGVRDNVFGIGSKVDVLAGAWRQRFEIRRPLPVHAGLGARESVDAVRLLWPGGVLQDEVNVPAGQATKVEQLDRKGTSCPLLYAWRDGGWRFVTDFLGGSAIGYRLDETTFNTPDTNEYVRIDGGLDAVDGALRLRLNNQLEEVLWFDQAELVAIDHPVGTEVYPDERLMPGPPWPEFRLLASSEIDSVRRATVPENGRDVTGLLAARDRQVVDDFAQLPYKGYAALHALELDLGAITPGERLVLLLDGWIDYADSSSNLAAAQAGVGLLPPRLLAPDGTGGWRIALERMGFPAGLPKTMAVDVTGLVSRNDPRVRIETSMRIYWDRVRVLRGGEDVPLRVTRVAPREATLRHGGFPRAFRPDGALPDVYDPTDVSPLSPWKAHAGAYTAWGDVLPLLAEIDDAFVTTRGGDEIELAFDAPAAQRPGWTRTYLLFADGFGKDMDPASASPDTVGPVPWHGMPAYPYDRAVAPPERGRSVSTRPGRLVTPDDDGLHGALGLPLARRRDAGAP